MELCPFHDDPAKYGHVMVEGPRVIALRDRPKDVVAPSLIQTGAWMFQPSVFDIVRELCDNRFKELCLNDVIVYMLTHGPVVHHLTITPGTFIDCGDVASVQCATNIWRKHTI